jgi:hypothetical protein
MKKLIGLLLFILTLISCHTAKNSVNSTIFNEGKIVFENYGESTNESKTIIESKLDSVIDKSIKDSTNNYSKAEMSSFKDFAVEQMLNFPKTQLIIDIDKDTIWRYKKENGEVVGEIEKLIKYNGLLSFYSRLDRSKESSKSIDLFKIKVDYKINIDKKQRKKILGYDCYKVMIVSKEENEMNNDFGDSIYEMYVSDRINLPIHALYNFTKLLPNCFPLELTITSSNMKGLKEIYKAVSIEHKK